VEPSPTYNTIGPWGVTSAEYPRNSKRRVSIEAAGPRSQSSTESAC